jgi:hypothetical protein
MAEDTQTAARPHSTGRSLAITALVLVLLAAVLWLASERNARQWFLVPEDGQLVVKKGVLFLTGRSSFKTDDPTLAQTYAPLRPPLGAPPPAEQAFDDRGGLDQGIYDILSRWARDDISSEDPQRLERGLAYITRAERLPGVSAAQRDDLRKLRGESGFYEAKSLLERGAEDLRLAREKLRLAADSPTRHAADASVLLRRIEPLVEETFSASRAAAGTGVPKAPAAGAPASAAAAPDGGAR